MPIHDNDICSPHGNKNKIKNGTCLPNKLLKTLKKRFNKRKVEYKQKRQKMLQTK